MDREYLDLRFALSSRAAELSDSDRDSDTSEPQRILLPAYRHRMLDDEQRRLTGDGDVSSVLLIESWHDVAPEMTE
jgi:hypothetical protein